MRLLLISCLVLLPLELGLAASVYKCTDKQGKVYFSDRMCPDGVRKDGSTWIDVQEEQARKREEEARKREDEAKEKAREAERLAKLKALRASDPQMIERQFSLWDGSHTNLTRLIKSRMNDPDSFDHIKTTYRDMGDHLVVTERFRGKNSFGGLVINQVVARVGLDGSILEILSEGAP